MYYVDVSAPTVEFAAGPGRPAESYARTEPETTTSTANPAHHLFHVETYCVRLAYTAALPTAIPEQTHIKDTVLPTTSVFAVDVLDLCSFAQMIPIKHSVSINSLDSPSSPHTVSRRMDDLDLDRPCTMIRQELY